LLPLNKLDTPDLLKSICEKCELALIALLVVGFLLTIMLLFMGVRTSGARGRLS